MHGLEGGESRVALSYPYHADWIICLVEESIIEPQGEDMRLWRFSGESMVRARSALRLQRDLGINMAGIALVLDLMEELESLRAHMKTLGDA
jgi:chaperone modulatory protein CbpM